MLNTGERVNELEIEALEAIRELLDFVPILNFHSVKHESRFGPDHGYDAEIEVSNAGKRYAIAVEVKSSGQPRFVRSAIYQLRNYTVHMDPTRLGSDISQIVPLLVTPYLSPESRQICIEQGVNYLDLVGNFRLTFGTVFMERTVAEKPKSEKKSLRSIFSPKASTILRIMMRDVDRQWRVADLAEQANASLGHVSNVRKALIEREWASEHDDGIMLTDPMAILKVWRENYRRPAGVRISGYTRFHGAKLDDRLRGVLNAQQTRLNIICSMHTAAKWIAPFSRDATNTFYADEQGAKLLEDMIDLSVAPKGANVIIKVLRDESYFDDAVEPAPGIFCTSPIQTYLDLWAGNDRDREAAAFLLEERYSWSH